MANFVRREESNRFFYSGAPEMARADARNSGLLIPCGERESVVYEGIGGYTRGEPRARRAE